MGPQTLSPPSCASLFGTGPEVSAASLTSFASCDLPFLSGSLLGWISGMYQCHPPLALGSLILSLILILQWDRAHCSPIPQRNNTGRAVSCDWGSAHCLCSSLILMCLLSWDLGQERMLHKLLSSQGST